MLQDARFAVRMLLKDRWFTLVAILALGLGIGLNATVFTFVNAVLIRGLPFHDPEQILHIGGLQTTSGNGEGVSWLDFDDYRQQTRTFSGLAAYRGGSFVVTEAGRPPERVRGVEVSVNTFSLLGQEPLHGRTFSPAEERPGAPPVVLVGYGLWTSRYAGDPSLVGRVIKVNDEAATIIGVMPQGMRFPNNAELWRPLVATGDAVKLRDARSLNLFGRLAEGKSRREALAELTTIARQLEAQYPETNRNIGVEIQTFNQRFNGGPIRMVFLSLLGAVGFVLLIACANVANLLLARSVKRSREIAVRVALGATRKRLVRQLLVESVMLACLGGIFGLGLARISVGLFDAAVADVGKPYWIAFTFDPTVFAYFAGICLLTGIIFGLAPALQVSRTNVNDVLKEGGRGNAGSARGRRLVSALVIAEIAMTLVLLVGAGLMIRSFLKLYNLDLGMETSSMLTMRIQLPESKYPTPEQRRLFYDALLARLQTVPGLDSVTISSSVPFQGSESRRFEIEGRPVARPEDRPRAGIVTISPSYFDTVGVQLRRGRPFRDTDGAEGSETIIVDERFASQFFPGEEIVGKRIRVAVDDAKQKPGSWLSVIGVTPTIRQSSPQNAAPDAVFYRPYRLNPQGFMSILTRSRTPPATLTPLVREAVQAADPDLPVFDVLTLDAALAQNRWPYRVFGTMFTIFAVIALVLSSVGIYAVTSYSVTQRTAEIGVRMALGAQPGQVSWLILRRGLVQLGIGLALGLPAAWFLSTALTSLVVQIPARDPVTFGAILLVLVLVTLAACLIPARRATRLDPVNALRAD
jgi:predicted permease